MTKAKNFLEVIFLWMFKHKLLSIFLFALVVAGSTYFGILQNKQKLNTERYLVTRQNLEEVVSLTGTVKPTEEANITFEKSGTVKTIDVTVGAKVTMGQKIATLSSSDDIARVAEAQANLDNARALLSDLQTGDKSETVDIKKADVEQAKTNLELSYKNGGDSVKNLSISGSSFVRDSFSSTFTGGYSEGFRVNISSCDSLLEGRVAQLRKDAETNLIQIENISLNYDSYDSATQEQKLTLVKEVFAPKVSEYLTALKDLYSLGCSVSNTNFDATRALITSSRNTWSSLNTDLSGKINAIKSAKLASVQATSDLTLSQSGQKSQKILQQEASVKAARAKLTAANLESEKNILTAPFDGVITNIDLKKGELAGPNDKSVSIISDSNFEIESKVSEVDVAKLSVGGKARVTFDAYGDQVSFEAAVSNISPAGIISEGVPTYKTIFNFSQRDERIRSGMTANINVITSVHENVVTIPARFILSSGMDKIVDVSTNGDDDFSEVKIRLGVKGSNAMVEILEGLNGGETIMVQK